MMMIIPRKKKKTSLHYNDVVTTAAGLITARTILVALLILGGNNSGGGGVYGHTSSFLEGGEEESKNSYTDNNNNNNNNVNHHHHYHHQQQLQQQQQLPTSFFCHVGEPTYIVGEVIYHCKSDFRARGGMCGTMAMTLEEQREANIEFTSWKNNKQSFPKKMTTTKKKNHHQRRRRKLSNTTTITTTRTIKKDRNPNQESRRGGCHNCIDWESTIITIPTHIHVIHSGSAGKKYTYSSNPTYIQNQIKVLNSGFRGGEEEEAAAAAAAEATIMTSTTSLLNYLPHPNGRSYDRYDPSDANTHIQFCLAGTTSTDHAAWYYDTMAHEVDMKSTLKVGGSETLNVYISTAGGYLGWAYFPKRMNFIQDGIVLLNDSLPGGTEAGYNEGDTLTHEAGHWLQLEHTHELGCAGPGDYMDLAPPSSKYASVKSCESYASFDCPVNRNNCARDGGKNPIHNFMSYSDDNCMDQFTPGQKVKLQQAWETYRHKEVY